MNRHLVWGLGALTLAGVVVFFVKAGSPSAFDVSNTCLTSETYHVHAHLTILAEGQPVTIPQGIGIPSSTCIRPLHTHETDGIIHVEFEYKRDFTLGEFFKVWGQPLSSTEVLSYQKDANHDLKMTVNGTPSDKWGDLVLDDKQEIVINYAYLVQ